jgi:hypothetical protein
MNDRRVFSPPWNVDESRESFCIRDAKGQALAYVYFEDETGRRMAMSRLTRDEARAFASRRKSRSQPRPFVRLAFVVFFRVDFAGVGLKSPARSQ